MSFISVLKAIGLAIAKGVQIAAELEGLIPAVQTLQPSIASQLNILKQVIDVVVSVEGSAASLAQHGLSVSGEQKMLMAVPQVAQLLAEAFKALGHPIDPAKLTTAAQGVAQGVVDALNGIEAPAAA